MSAPTSQPITRREFSALGLATLGTAALGLWAGSSKSGAKIAGNFQHRPPGAGGLRREGQADPGKAEEEFLAKCVRCGQCAAPCPDQEFDGQKRKAIQFHGVEAGPQAGTPYITPRTAPCLMCVDVPCVKACPTGALDPRLTDINDARMGTACMVDREGCLAIQGLRCEVCYDRCPLRGVAITLEHTVNERTQRHAILEPVVHKEACTGCGICEQVCIREEPVIKVLRHIPVARDSDRFYELKPTKPGAQSSQSVRSGVSERAERSEIGGRVDSGVGDTQRGMATTHGAGERPSSGAATPGYEPALGTRCDPRQAPDSCGRGRPHSDNCRGRLLFWKMPIGLDTSTASGRA